MSDEEESSTRDDLVGVLTDIGAEIIEDPEEAVEGQPRDTSGKFASTEQPEVAVESEPASTWEDRPPTSWKPAAREKWAQIPDDLRAEIVRREEASVNGVRHLNEQYAPMKALTDSVGPFFQDILEKGGDPAQYSRNLLEIDYKMRYAQQPADKLGVLFTFAEAYGVPLRNILNKALGREGQPEMFPTPQQQGYQLPPEVARELEEARQFRQQFTTQTATHEVETFGQDKEYFNDVRHVMADLIESGVAKDMEDAYDKACWALPEVREVMLNKQQGQQRRQAAAGASLRPNGSVPIKQDDQESDDVGAILRQEFQRSATGRV